MDSNGVKVKVWPQKRWKQVLLAIFIILVIAFPAAILYMGYANREPTFKADISRSLLVINSPAFDNGSAIPVKYTAQGDNINPPLRFQGVSEETQSLVIVVDDPMFPVTWNHWVIWNIPPNETIEENTSVGVQGKNGWNRPGYGGPDPVGGTHTYVFSVYALDCTLDLNVDAGKTAVLRAMDNHVLAKAQLIGTYAK
jgi:Raf kinase inhibitor-like YbhB/YbcL family protein